MALTLVAEDGTGLSTANVYDLAAACVAFLADRGKTVFAAADAAQRDIWLLEATELMERLKTSSVTGDPINGDDQAMLYPRAGAVDRRLRRWESTERPAPHREAIFLLAEEVAIAAGKGETISGANALANIKSHGDGAKGRIEYRSAPSFADDFPQVMMRAAEAHPSGIYSQRA